MDDLTIDYVEFSSRNISASIGFLAQAFGWAL